jgi:hypothetical protein
MAEIDVMFEKVFGDSSSGFMREVALSRIVIIADEMQNSTRADVDVGWKWRKNALKTPDNFLYHGRR